MVDDDPNFLESAKKCLELQGDLAIEAALSCAEAIEKMKNKKPDVIVCDIQMPVTNGLEFLKVLRNSDNDVPFIVFTITGDNEMILNAFNLGVNGFVGKCGDPSVVYPKIKRCIETVTRISVNKKEQVNLNGIFYLKTLFSKDEM